MHSAAHQGSKQQPGPPICPRCGIIAPTEDRECELCRTAFGYPRRAAPKSRDGSYWVAVRASFQCRSCSFLSPLDSLDVDGSVECAQCGMEQRFDVGAWLEALHYAHAVGDLAYPPPEGRHPHPYIWIGGDNPHLRVGYTEAFAEHRQSSTNVEGGVHVHRSLFIKASPGHPVCARCNEPLETTLAAGGVSSTRCPKCEATASYRLPSGAERYNPALLGTVCPDHRTDRRAATMVSTAGGPISLRCPQCDGALPASRERVITCIFCKTAVLIPARARLRDAGAQVEPEIWWLAFRGPSQERAQLEWPTYEADGEKQADGEKAGDGEQAKPSAIKKVLDKLDDKSPLELAPRRPGTHWAQIALRIVLPLLALAVGFVVTWVLGLKVGE